MYFIVHSAFVRIKLMMMMMMMMIEVWVELHFYPGSLLTHHAMFTGVRRVLNLTSIFDTTRL